MIDFSKPIWILAVPSGDRLGVLGGSNDEREARLGAIMSPSIVLLRAEAVENNGLPEGDEE